MKAISIGITERRRKSSQGGPIRFYTGGETGVRSLRIWPGRQDRGSISDEENNVNLSRNKRARGVLGEAIVKTSERGWFREQIMETRF